MIGIMMLLVAGTYIAIWILVVRFSYRLTFRVTESKKKSFSIAAAFFLIMYLVPLWDLIPTLIMHKYYCDNEAGFTVYKSLAEWEKENPEILNNLSFHNLPEEYRRLPSNSDQKTDRYYMLPDGSDIRAIYNLKGDLIHVEFTKPNGMSGTWLNERFIEINRSEWLFNDSIFRKEKILEDRISNKIIARSIDFLRGKSGTVMGVGGSPNEIRKALILGWGNRQCPTGKSSYESQYYYFLSNFFEKGDLNDRS
jgi:hypothetical protein